eukprot:c8376_g2_i1.p1 GENE.c8376_g2_i1~~c8376_g2_i1.p1  ORF type:complete len:198 (-),score=67.54 c8376_g2_i1:22-615(-)
MYKLFSCIACIVSTLQLTFILPEENLNQFREILYSWDKTKHILITEAIISLFACSFGLPYFTVYLESCVGAAIGGRTGLVSITNGFCHLFMFFFRPIYCLIPIQSTAALRLISVYLYFKIAQNLTFENSDGLITVLCLGCLASDMDIAMGPCLAFIIHFIFCFVDKDWEKINLLVFIFAFGSLMLLVMVVIRDSSDD